MINQVYKKKIDDTNKTVPDTSGIVKKADHKATITEMEGNN